MNTSIARRIVTAVAATGIFLGGSVIATAIATAQQAPDGQCAGMTMTNGRPAVTPNALTRAGQIGAAGAPSASDGSMAVNCQPASHG